MSSIVIPTVYVYKEDDSFTHHCDSYDTYCFFNRKKQTEDKATP